MTRIKLLGLLPNLNGGGAERMMITLVGGLHRDQFDITLALGEISGPYVPLIPSDIRVVDLGASRAAVSVPAIARLMRRERFDVSFSMVGMNLAAVLARALSLTRVGLVLGARNHYSASIPAEASASRAKMMAIRLLYPRADLVVAVSDGVRDDLVRNFGLSNDHVVAIHNPIDLERVRVLAAEPLPDPWLASTDRPLLVAVGKLQVAKGYPDLLEAFRRLRRRVPARLAVLGEGPERPWIERYLIEHDLQTDVRLFGFQDNPFRYLARATAFVHAAHWEGFPNVLVEAMACGAAVVSTDCPSGPSEIITSGTDGLLVPVADPEALATAILHVLEEPQLRGSLIRNGLRRVEAFSPGEILRRYAAAFNAVAAPRGSR